MGRGEEESSFRHGNAAHKPRMEREAKRHHLPTVISDPQDGVMHGSKRKLKLSGLKLAGGVKERRNPADTPSPPRTK